MGGEIPHLFGGVSRPPGAAKTSKIHGLPSLAGLPLVSARHMTDRTAGSSKDLLPDAQPAQNLFDQMKFEGVMGRRCLGRDRFQGPSRTARRVLSYFDTDLRRNLAPQAPHFVSNPCQNISKPSWRSSRVPEADLAQDPVGPRPLHSSSDVSGCEGDSWSLLPFSTSSDVL
jgi:hypothetical protein